MFAFSALTHRSFESSYSTDSSSSALSIAPSADSMLFELDPDETMTGTIPAAKLPSREVMVNSVKQQILVLAERTNGLIAYIHTWAAQPFLQGSYLQVAALNNASNTQKNMQAVVAKIERLDAHFALRPDVPAEGDVKSDLRLLSRATVIDALGSLQFHELALSLAINSSSEAVRKWLELKQSTSKLSLRYRENVAPLFDATLAQKGESERFTENLRTLLTTEGPYLPASIQAQIVRIVRKRDSIHLALDQKLTAEQEACRIRLG